MSASGRGDFGGIDNEALDFSQLTDYINDDNDSNIYFHEALVGSDIKLNESPTPTTKSLGGSGSAGPLPTHSAASPTISSSSIERGKSNLGSGGLSPHSLEGAYCPSISTTSCGSPTISTTVQSYKGSNHLPNLTHYQQSHHLPDSPPDSGSEPPFSPPNEDHRLSGNHLNSSASHSRSSQHQNSSSQPAEVMMHSQAESLKHFIAYSSTQPLKHLPDNTSLALDPHQHAALQQLQPNLGHHLTTTTSAGAVLTQLGQALPQLVHGNVLPPLTQALVSPSNLGALYGSDEFLCDSLSSPSNNNPTKKRKLSESPKNAVSSTVLGNGNGMVNIKQEPDGLSPEPATSVILGQSEDEYSFDFNGPDTGMFMDSAYQCIRFQAFQPNTWHTLCDTTLKELPAPNYRVDADKGFNFSNADEAFVCQKKNHFQVTVHIQAFGGPQFIKSSEGLKKVENFYLHFHGAKVESPSQTIKVEQSQSDRSKKPFHPVLVDLTQEQVIKTTVGRLHFSETTSNNMRKKGKPNPDQRYFYLVVGLYAHIGDQTYPIVAHASERIIVRASNPGQFENDMELSWQKGHTPESIYHAGRVGINTDRPDESLVIHGNVRVTGHIVQPSDARAKQKVQELDTKEQLKNVANMKIVNYEYRPEFAWQAGIEDSDRRGTGVIAQEVRRILPDAVREAGDVVLPGGETIEKFLVVNKERIFMENVGAVKELCKVTDNLENRIDELERINSKLSKLKRLDSLKSTSSGSTVTSGSSSVTIGRKHNHRKHNSRRRARNDENTFCSNRLVQGTIVVLVLVMAFCLAAVASLYILEWQRRHSSISDAYLTDGKILKSTTSFTTHFPTNYISTTNHNPDYGRSGAKQQETEVSNGDKVSKFLKESNSAHFPTTSEGESDTNALNNVSSVHTILPTNLPWPGSSTGAANATSTASIPILKPRVIGAPAECRTLPTNPLPTSCQVSCCSTGNTMTQMGSHREGKTSESIIDSGYENSNVTRAGLEGRSLNLSVTAPQSLGGEISNGHDEYRLHPNLHDAAATKFGTSPHQELEENRQSGGNSSSSYRNEGLTNSDLENPRMIQDVQDNSASSVITPGAKVSELDNTNHSHQENPQSGTSGREDREGGGASQKNSHSSATRNQSVSRQKKRSITPSRRKRRDSRGQFSKASAGKDLSRSVESIKVSEFNATIGPEYCSTWQCLHKSGPAFGYHVPISKFMTHEFIILQFNLATPLIVEHCEPKDKTVACSVPRNVPRGPENNLVEELISTWRIPVGLYLRSSYRFRIMSRSIGDIQPCSLSEDELGLSFIEYNLVFQRKCDS